MNALLRKECKLATPAFVYVFLLFVLMTFIPGYPILCSAFFTCLGMFQGYQSACESSDLAFTLLLPVRKKDIVRAKFLFACAFEMMALLLMTLFTIVRMTALSGAAVYLQNFLMAANPTFLAFALLIFAAFNAIFLAGFFKTAYRCGRPFLAFICVGFVIIGIAETLHHLPGMHGFNAISGEGLKPQFTLLAAAVLIYIGVTLLACRISEKRFEAIDF